MVRDFLYDAIFMKMTFFTKKNFFTKRFIVVICYLSYFRIYLFIVILILFFIHYILTHYAIY